MNFQKLHSSIYLPKSTEQSYPLATNYHHLIDRSFDLIHDLFFVIYEKKLRCCNSWTFWLFWLVLTCLQLFFVSIVSIVNVISSIRSQMFGVSFVISKPINMKWVLSSISIYFILEIICAIKYLEFFHSSLAINANACRK